MQLLLINECSGGPSVLAQRLSKSGFQLREVASLTQASLPGAADGASILLLDQDRNSASPTQGVTRLRSSGLAQPMLVLTMHNDWRERVSCIEAGADDVLVKPIHSEEVAARLRAMIRRSVGASTDRIAYGDIDLDLKARCAWRGGKCLDLTRNEFRLLRLFLLAPDRTVTKDAIARSLWPNNRDISLNAIEVQVARLRRKVGDDRIRTLRGLGYRIAVAAGEPADTATRDVCVASCRRMNEDDPRS